MSEDVTFPLFLQSHHSEVIKVSFLESKDLTAFLEPDRSNGVETKELAIEAGRSPYVLRN